MITIKQCIKKLKTNHQNVMQSMLTAGFICKEDGAFIVDELALDEGWLHYDAESNRFLITDSGLKRLRKALKEVQMSAYLLPTYISFRTVEETKIKLRKHAKGN